MDIATLSDAEFREFQHLIYKIAGISLSPAKKPLVSARLEKRLREHKLGSYGAYFDLLTSRREAGEMQMAVDLLTTNETCFFRESDHFDFLHGQASERKEMPFRVWSAASSSGQEPYSAAMVLDRLGGGWDVTASDISTLVLERAKNGHYPMEQARHIPEPYLSKYCLRGIRSQAGTFLMARGLRSRIDFRQINLNAVLPKLGMFDLIFLRNVMIYFNQETKRKVVQRVMDKLKPGGFLLIGHSETLNGIVDGLVSVMPSIYCKP